MTIVPSGIPATTRQTELKNGLTAEEKADLAKLFEGKNEAEKCQGDYKLPKEK